MGYISKNLVNIAKGYTLEENHRNQKVILRSCKVTATLLLTHYVLQIPTIQHKLESLILPLYDGQRSNVGKWTIRQRLGFLIGVGQGIVPAQWAAQFGVSEKTIHSIYNTLGLSVRLRPTVTISRPVEPWERTLLEAWYSNGMKVSKMATRLNRDPRMIFTCLNMSHSQSKYDAIYFSSDSVSQGRVHLTPLNEEIKSLVIDWRHPMNPKHDDHFILRSLHSTYPIILAATVLEFCSHELKSWWDWMVREPTVPLNFHRLRWLAALSKMGKLPEIKQSIAVCRHDLQKLGVRFENLDWCPRQGVPFSEWESTLCREWVGNIHVNKAAKRLMRPIFELPSPIQELFNQHKGTVEDEKTRHFNLIPEKHKLPKITWNAVEAANLCQNCHRAVISPPFEQCRHCLLQNPSPKYNPRLVLEKGYLRPQ